MVDVQRVLMKDAFAEITARREFDAGNMHGRWEGSAFTVRSYEDRIAWSDRSDDWDGREVWHMRYATDCSKTTRWHLNIVQRAVNNLLW